VGRIEASFQTLDERLRRIVADVSALDEDKGGIDVYDLPARIDARLPEEILAFAEARQTIAHAWGATVYADVMSHFAAGERYMNRVWSAAADGYVDEARAYIARALEQFEETLEQLEGLKTRPALSQRARR
jgi:hypothetical protein